MRTHYLLCIALLCAHLVWAEPEAEPKAEPVAEPVAEAKAQPEADPEPRTKAVAARFYKPVHAPVALSEDKVYLLFGRNAPNNPVSIESAKNGLVDADDLQVQSFHPIYDEDLGTVLIPTDAISKFNGEDSELEEVEDSEDLGRQNRRRRPNRRRTRRRRRRQRRRRQRVRRRRRTRRNRRRRQRRRHHMRRRRNRRRRGGSRRRFRGRGRDSQRSD